MLIPINIRGRRDLCLSVDKLLDGTFSISINETFDESTLNSLPSYTILEGGDENYSPVTETLDKTGIITTDNLLEGIEEMLNKANRVLCL